MGHGCHDCGCPNGCNCGKPSSVSGKIDYVAINFGNRVVTATKVDPVMLEAEQQYNDAESRYRDAQANVKKVRQEVQTRIALRLQREDKDKEIADLEERIKALRGNENRAKRESATQTLTDREVEQQ